MCNWCPIFSELVTYLEYSFREYLSNEMGLVFWFTKVCKILKQTVFCIYVLFLEIKWLIGKNLSTITFHLDARHSYSTLIGYGSSHSFRHCLSQETVAEKVEQYNR